MRRRSRDETLTIGSPRASSRPRRPSRRRRRAGPDTRVRRRRRGQPERVRGLHAAEFDAQVGHGGSSIAESMSSRFGCRCPAPRSCRPGRRRRPRRRCGGSRRRRRGGGCSWPRSTGSTDDPAPSMARPGRASSRSSRGSWPSALTIMSASMTNAEPGIGRTSPRREPVAGLDPRELDAGRPAVADRPGAAGRTTRTGRRRPWPARTRRRTPARRARPADRRSSPTRPRAARAAVAASIAVFPAPITRTWRPTSHVLERLRRASGR